MTDLRPYQADAVDAIRACVMAGSKAPLLVMPTGSGKTHVAKTIIESAVGKGKQVLFLAPRRELIYQTAEKLDEAGIEYGIIMAGEQKNMFAPVQVACIPTIFRRLEHTLPPPADLVIVDEAHLSISRMAKTVMDAYPSAHKIGLTATPSRTDGKGLGEVYDQIVMGPSVAALTDQGFLVKAEYYAPSKPDLEGVKITAGDYNKKQLGERMFPLIGDVVSNWARIARDRQTVVFSVNVAHSRHLCEMFNEFGVRAEHIDARTPTEDRKAILKRVKAGDTQVICNCDVLSYGWDSPPISCAVLARPTKSLARYLQAAGRILRPYPGKENCIIIDHTGVVDTLGFVDDVIPWTLDGDDSVEERKKETQKKEPVQLTCPKCAATFKESDTCPACGHRMVDERKKAIEARDADLAAVDRKTRMAMGREWTPEEKRNFYGELLGIARQRKYKDGWAAMKYKEKLGVWPVFKGGVVPATLETLSWVKSSQIAWAKSQQRKQANG